MDRNDSATTTPGRRRRLGYAWLIGLNALLWQFTVRLAGTNLPDFWRSTPILFGLGWLAISILLAAAIARLVSRWPGEASQIAWIQWVLLALAAIVGTLASVEPRLHFLFGSAEFSLSAYPLAGLGLKAVTVLVVLAAGWIEWHEDVDETIESSADPSRLSAWAGVGVTAAVVASMILLPLAPNPAQSWLDRPSDRTQAAIEIGESGLPLAAPVELPVNYEGIGPALAAAGAIDRDQLAVALARTGEQMSDEQRAVLSDRAEERIEISAENAHFLLDLFWALGLVNNNRVLTEGAMVEAANEDIGRYASTGGWSLGTRSGSVLYASAEILALTEDQQALVERLARSIYRPCCNNPTSFPDCNHGMAMLGLLELMASQGATETQMWQAAKSVNAFWFPGQMTEVATIFKVADGKSFAQLEPQQILGPTLFSASGFSQVHAWLQANGLLGGATDSGGSCGA
jgi:hypothetical protein